MFEKSFILLQLLLNTWKNFASYKLLCATLVGMLLKWWHAYGGVFQRAGASRDGDVDFSSSYTVNMDFLAASMIDVLLFQYVWVTSSELSCLLKFVFVQFNFNF